MTESRLTTLALFLTVAAGLAAVFYWFAGGVDLSLAERLPGADQRPAVDEGGAGASIEAPPGEVTKGPGVPSDLPGDWPGFRGPRGDNIATSSFTPHPSGEPDEPPIRGFVNMEDEVFLFGASREEGPEYPLRWSIGLGEGHAGAAVRDGRVFVFDYDREKSRDTMRCLSLDDGREIWRYAYPVRVKRNHGMSRTVPAVGKDFVVGLGPKCHLICLEIETGMPRWTLNLTRAYGAKVPPWYAGQCPLLDEDPESGDLRLVVAPGGRSLVVALDPITGKPIWESSNPRGWAMTHSSVVPMTFGKERFFVYCAGGGVAGVSAKDGSILWDTTEWKIRIANVPTPVVAGEGLIFLSGGYGAGSMMLALEQGPEGIRATPRFRLPPERFGSAQQTPILIEDHLFGVRPDGQFVCLNLNGDEVWASGAANVYGLGPYLAAGGLFHVVDDDGWLSRIEIRTDAFRLLDRVRVLEGHDAWGPMAFAGGLLIVRDLTRMVCIDLRVGE